MTTEDSALQVMPALSNIYFDLVCHLHHNCPIHEITYTNSTFEAGPRGWNVRYLFKCLFILFTIWNFFAETTRIILHNGTLLSNSVVQHVQWHSKRTRRTQLLHLATWILPEFFSMTIHHVMTRMSGSSRLALVCFHQEYRQTTLVWRLTCSVRCCNIDWHLKL